MNVLKCSYCEWLSFTSIDGKIFFKCLNPKGNCKIKSVKNLIIRKGKNGN